MTAGYTRLSFDKYDDQLGVTRQREDIAALARSLGWPEVTEFYEDNDVSANVDKKRPRPEFDRLLRDMTTGTVSYVLCYDQDRLVRDMRQLEDVVDAVEAGGVVLTSVNGDIDLRSDNGRMVARIKAAVARNEIEKMSRRPTRQQLQRAQLGMKHGSGRRTFGYERDFAVVPAEAAIIVELFRRRAAGERVPSLVRWLNDSGVETTTGLVGRWTHVKVTTILRRREYVGDVTLKGVVVGSATFESIVDRKVFEKVNSLLPVTPSPWRATKESGLLSGLLVCATCGTRMPQGRGTTSLRRYRCRGVPPLCPTQLSANVDGAVVAAVTAKLRELESGGAWFSVQARAIEHEIEQARRLNARGALSQADLNAVLKHMQRRLAEERRLPGESGGNAEAGDWDDWTLEARRDWVSRVVDQIIVTAQASKNSRVDLSRVTLHFKDGQIHNLGGPRSSATMRDVAKLAGCTYEHASRILHGVGSFSPASEARVRAAVAELGYVVGPHRLADKARRGHVQE